MNNGEQADQAERGEKVTLSPCHPVTLSSGDGPFLICLAILGGSYVVLIVAMRPCHVDRCVASSRARTKALNGEVGDRPTATRSCRGSPLSDKTPVGVAVACGAGGGPASRSC